MITTVYPGSIKGVIRANPGKSHMQRLIAAYLLLGKNGILHPASDSDDCMAMLQVAVQLGATTNWLDKNTVQLRCPDPREWMEREDPIYVHFHESGLASRMMIPVLCLSQARVHITASGSLRNRPMTPLYELFRQWNIHYTGDGKMIPETIQGPVQWPETTITNATASSQYLTGILMAAAASDKALSIQAGNISSRPYTDLTLAVLEKTGLRIPEEKETGHFYFSHRKVSTGKTANTQVEGDWSGAAFLLVGAAISGEVTITGLDPFSTQADKSIIHALHECGVPMSLQPTLVEVKKAPGLKPFHFNAADCPDLFPPLAALAACTNGKSIIEGIHRLTHKESNRALSIQHQLGLLGVEVTLQDDLMIIEGSELKDQATVSGCNDHRIVMMLSILALRAKGAITIEGAEAINKSYPEFFVHLNRLGIATKHQS